MKPQRRIKLEKPEEVAKNFCKLGEDPEFLIKAWINDEIGRLLDSLIELFFVCVGSVFKHLLYTTCSWILHNSFGSLILKVVKGWLAYLARHAPPNTGVKYAVGSSSTGSIIRN